MNRDETKTIRTRSVDGLSKEKLLSVDELSRDVGIAFCNSPILRGCAFSMLVDAQSESDQISSSDQARPSSKTSTSLSIRVVYSAFPSRAGRHC